MKPEMIDAEDLDRCLAMLDPGIRIEQDTDSGLPGDLEYFNDAELS